MTARSASCLNPEHPEFEGAVCPACHAALEAEHTRLNDLYMRLLTENGELERKVRQAESDGLLPLNCDGHTRAVLSPAGAEMIDGTAYLQLRGRTRVPSEDTVLLSVGHRTLGNPRSILLERPAAELLLGWLASWVANGWPGVPRRCGARHRPTRLQEWVCDQDPGHGTRHEGPPVGWLSAAGKPGRESWPWVPGERELRGAVLTGSRG